jgi:non-specific serine/threonine protein kinase
MVHARQALSLHNLPTRLSSFVGRAQDTAEVARLLTMSRLVTLTGAGGCGKTRLAEHVARTTTAPIADDIWYVPLAALSDGALVPRAVASVLGLPEQPDQPVADSLVGYLAPLHGLLILDNCEHLLDACAQLTMTLLSACQDVRVLATSREPLNVDGESVWVVPSLSVPPADTPISQLLSYDAIRLFCDRAEASSSAFHLSSGNAVSVAHICQQLDGIPLAIELAAARLKALTAEQIATRLDDALRLLTVGKRGAPPRHQTLRAALEWSDALLPQAERTLFHRLSVFAGGFSLDAAAAVCEVAHRAGSEVLDRLAPLVDKSLVQVVSQPYPAAMLRYRLLETMRQYGSEHTRRAGELEVLCERHAEFYLALAAVEWPQLVGEQQAQWLAQLETEHDNLRAALAWSLSAAGHPELGLSLAAALCWFWWTHGYLSEARHWLSQALAAPLHSRTRMRAQALCWAGIFGAGMQRDLRQAATLLEESLALSQELQLLGEMSWASVNLARVAEQAGETAKAEQLAAHGVALSRDLGDPWAIAQALERYGEVVRFQGDFARAAALYDESLALSCARGDKRNIATLLHNLGHVHLHRRDIGQAAVHFADSFALAHEIHDQRRVVMCLEGVACSAAQAGRAKEAAALFGAAHVLRQRLGAAFEAADLVAYNRSVAHAHISLGQAVWNECYAAGEKMSQDEALQHAQALCAQLTQSAPPASPSPARRSDARDRQAFGGLTARQREVATMLVLGKSNREIAAMLVVSERTVDKHVGQILAKLGFRSRAQVAAWAVVKGLATPQ